MSFKVLLINPNVPGNYRKAKIATTNLGLSFLSAYVQRENSVECSIIDARFLGKIPQQVFEQVSSFSPQLIGISLLVDEASQWTESFLHLVRKKYPTIPIVLGGYFPSLLPETVLGKFPLADLAILGEGEITLSELIEAIQKNKDWKHIPGIAYRENEKILFSPPRALLENLDDLPYAERYMAEGNGHNMEAMLEGTRGCLFSCSFCAVHPFHKRSVGSRLRLRSAESLAAEVETLCRTYPQLQSFRFVDPDFISPHTEQRAATFARLLKNNIRDIDFMCDTRINSVLKNKALLTELQQVGLKRLYLGIESGSDKILQKMRKGISRDEILAGIQILKEIGIDYSYGFMMITPWSLEQDIEDNIEILSTIGRIEFRSLFHEMTLIPGTKAFQMVQESDELSWCGSLSYYSFHTRSPKVEKFRKIGRLLQKKYPECFGESAGYLYESVRQLRRVGQISFAETLERRLDQLFLDVFHTCWNESSSIHQTEEHDIQFIDECHKQFSPHFQTLLHMLDPSLDCQSTKQRIPQYAPTRQI